MMNILFKLPHTLRRKRMRHRLPLARMFRTIPRIEQSPSNTHKGIIILAFQEPIAVAVDLWNGICVRDANVVRLDAHEFAVFGVCGVHGEKALSAAALGEQPEVCEGRGEWGGDGADLPVAEVGEEVVEDGEEEEGVWRQEVVC